MFCGEYNLADEMKRRRVEDVDGHFRVLGMSKSVECAAVKRQFRKLSLKAHPDKGGDAEVFKRMNNAAEILSNPQLRQVYESKCSDAQRNFRGTDPSEEVFANCGFTASRNHEGALSLPIRKGADLTHEMSVSVKEVRIGCVKRVQITRDVPDYSVLPSKCVRCTGRGFYSKRSTYAGQPAMVSSFCSDCWGEGITRAYKRETVALPVPIPAASWNGREIRMHGQGSLSCGGMVAGDIVIVVKVRAPKPKAASAREPGEPAPIGLSAPFTQPAQFDEKVEFSQSVNFGDQVYFGQRAHPESAEPAQPFGQATFGVSARRENAADIPNLGSFDEVFGSGQFVFGCDLSGRGPGFAEQGHGFSGQQGQGVSGPDCSGPGGSEFSGLNFGGLGSNFSVGTEQFGCGFAAQQGFPQAAGFPAGWAFPPGWANQQSDPHARTDNMNSGFGDGGQEGFFEPDDYGPPSGNYNQPQGNYSQSQGSYSQSQGNYGDGYSYGEDELRYQSHECYYESDDNRYAQGGYGYGQDEYSERYAYSQPSNQSHAYSQPSSQSHVHFEPNVNGRRGGSAVFPEECEFHHAGASGSRARSGRTRAGKKSGMSFDVS